jgi:hypothetical protein
VTAPSTSPPAKSGSPLNRIGVIVLLVGLCIAGVVYGKGQWDWSRQQKASGLDNADGNYQDQTLGVDDSKKVNRDVAMYSGKLGVFSAEMTERWQSLKPFESTAILIAVFSVAGALCCFLAATFGNLSFDPEERPPGS